MGACTSSSPSRTRDIAVAASTILLIEAARKSVAVVTGSLLATLRRPTAPAKARCPRSTTATLAPGVWVAASSLWVSLNNVAKAALSAGVIPMSVATASGTTASCVTASSGAMSRVAVSDGVASTVLASRAVASTVLASSSVVSGVSTRAASKESELTSGPGATSEASADTSSVGASEAPATSTVTSTLASPTHPQAPSAVPDALQTWLPMEWPSEHVQATDAPGMHAFRVGAYTPDRHGAERRERTRNDADGVASELHELTRCAAEPDALQASREGMSPKRIIGRTSMDR